MEEYVSPAQDRQFLRNLLLEECKRINQETELMTREESRERLFPGSDFGDDPEDDSEADCGTGTRAADFDPGHLHHGPELIPLP